MYNNEGIFFVLEINFFLLRDNICALELIFWAFYIFMISNYIKTHSMWLVYVKYFWISYWKFILNGVIMDATYTIKSNINQI